MKRKLRFLAGACLFTATACSLAVARTMTF